MSHPRILVTGSRNWTNRNIIKMALKYAWEDLGLDPKTTLVSGACPTGADRIAEEEWESLGLPIERHPAGWSQHGRAAGPIRNQEMVDLGADVCLAFAMPDSRGTHDCIRRASDKGIPTQLFYDANEGDA